MERRLLEGKDVVVDAPEERMRVRVCGGRWQVGTRQFRIGSGACKDSVRTARVSCSTLLIWLHT